MRLPSPAGGVLAAALLLLLLSSRALCNCPAPDLPPHSELRGSALQATYDVGTVLRFRCIIGYEYIAGITPSITCLASSAWTTIRTFCQGRRCPHPNLPNGKIVSTTDIRLGEDVTFACDYGFRLIGQTTLRCILKAGEVQWNKDIPLCQHIPCVRPTKIPNGHYNPDPMDSYEVGAAITYWCNAGLSLIGKSTITCTVTPDGLNGMWDLSPPECKRVSCPRPNIQNGRFINVLASVYTYSDSVSFRCDLTYTAVGIGLITCGADNNWHPSAPYCIKGAVTPVQPSVPPVQPPISPVQPPVPPVHPPQPPGSPVPVTVPPTEGTEEVPGYWKTVSIALGSVAAALLLSCFVCYIFAAVKRSSRQEKIERSPPPSAPPVADYSEVPESDIALEEKTESH